MLIPLTHCFNKLVQLVFYFHFFFKSMYEEREVEEGEHEVIYINIVILSKLYLLQFL